METEELRKKNLAVINRATKLAMFTLARSVRADKDLFGPTDMTVDNVDFNKLIESMVLDRIDYKASYNASTRRLEIL